MMHSGPRKEIREAGFSLVEVIVTLAIAAIVLLIAAPSLRRSSPDLDVRAHAMLMTSSLRAAHAHSMARGQDISFEFEPESRAWSIKALRIRRLMSVGINLTLTGARSRIDDPSPVRIVFFPDGSSTGGQMRLKGLSREAIISVGWLDSAVVLEDIRDIGP